MQISGKRRCKRSWSLCGQTRSGTWWTFRLGVRLLGTSGFSRSNTIRMVRSKGIRRDSLQRAIPRERVLTMMKPFYPVVRFASLHAILAIIAKLDLELVQMDVMTAFLIGELDEEIIMDQPEGFRSESQESKVYRLKRSIYRLKQSSREWYL